MLKYLALIQYLGPILAAHAQDARRRRLPDILVLGGLLFFSCMAIVCLVVTLYLYLVANMEIRHAMLIMSGVAIIIAGGFAIAVSPDHGRHIGNRNGTSEDMDTSAIEKFFTENATNVSLIALVAGMVLGASPGLRKTIFDFIK